MGRSLLFFVVVSSTVLAATIGVAYREGPLPSMTGGFGEETCRSCHFDNPANDPGGSLRVAGVPDVYQPGKEYGITVEVRRPAMARSGFEMAVRFSTPPRTGEQAGRLRSPDDRTQIVHAPGSAVEYIQHTKAGSAAGQTGTGRWTIRWTAPTGSRDPIVFHLAANASNDDASPLGDFIYTAVVKSHGGSGVRGQAPLSLDRGRR